MRKPVSQQRLSPQGWGLRLILAGAMGWIGYLSVMQSVALVLPSDQIEEAYKIAPNNGYIAGRLSQTLYNPEASEADRAQAVALAHDAVRNDPMAVEAVAILAADAFIQGKQAEAERLLAYSQKLSRRELRTQLMAIELAVARNDISGALQHYDIALRTKRNAPEILFPILTAALPDPMIRKELVKTLSGKPKWGAAFINQAAAKTSDAATISAFFRELQAARLSVPDAASQVAINRLLTAKLFDDAWSYYAAVRPGSDRRQSRDPNFSLSLETPSGFDWIATNNSAVSTAIFPDAQNGLFDFSVSMGNGGRLLQQLQMLPPGDYIIEGESSGIEQPSRSRPYWVLHCQGGGEIARVDLPNSSESGGRFRGHLSVPANCPAQMLALVARSSDDISGVSGQINRVKIRPATVAGSRI